MRRSVISIILVVVLITMSSSVAYAADSTDLQLYMGIKAHYVWQDSATTAEEAPQAGETSPMSAGYTFTTKDSDELVAQALSDNNPEVTEGFIRQLPMRDLVKILDTIKSAADILQERNREDLLAKAYAGGYIAPEHTVVSSDPSGVDSVRVDNVGLPSWALTGDIGLLGDKVPIPLGGRVNILSVFGEPYRIGNNSYDASEVVFDTTKENNVYALFNGYITYIGGDVIELMTYDQAVTVRYRGVNGLDGTVTGSVFSQGMQIGTTSDFTLSISLSVDNVPRNLLQVYTESISKEWFSVWETKYGATRGGQMLVLNDGDSNYHITANELPANVASSYVNPEDFGVNPNAAPTIND